MIDMDGDPEVPNAPAFMHKPLDQPRGSFRLLRVTPEKSTEGRIQCTTNNSTIDASHDQYTCLSYTWGLPDDDDHDVLGLAILVNGRSMSVGRNLRHFLEVAAKKYPLMHLWIDAVCIDQVREF
jgi:hypothetical protein